jgi:hypothetical protein
VVVNYVAPLQRAWGRMRRQLFSPFHLERWLVVGFAAFLEGLASAPFAGGGGSRWNVSSDHVPDAGALDQAWAKTLDFLSNPLWLSLILAALIAFAVIYAALVWVSARGHFVFLEMVMTGRPAFRAPWTAHRALGNSLFLFWAALSFAWLVPIALAIAGLAPVARHWYETRTFAAPSALALVVGVGGALLASLAIVIVGVLTHDFVIPLMWRHGEGATRAWARFRPLLAAHAGDFAAYLLFLALVSVLVGIAILIVGFASCCVGFLLLAIPFVGTVATLPLLVTERAFGAEFLAQFGPEWNVFPAEEPAAPDED